ncbi:MAG: hypothetical protein Q4G34_09930 [Micrococcus sp.]|nr:hypothetical protein [Micrococcus sp.]
MTLPQTSAEDPRTPDRHAPHGPGPTSGLVPGKRASLMIVSAERDVEAAMREAMDWLDAFTQNCGLVLNAEETDLYAVAQARTLTGQMSMPRAGAGLHQTGVAEFIDFILHAGRWHHADAPRPVPQDAEGVHPWAWTYYELLHQADPEAWCTVWDVFPLPAAH